MEFYNRNNLALEQAIHLQNVKADMQAFYKIELGEDKQSIMVEPVNGEPYIYITGGDTYQFNSIPRSGTSKLRARVACQLFFDKINENALAKLNDSVL